VTVTYYVYAPVPARCPSANWLRTLRLNRKICLLIVVKEDNKKAHLA